MNCQSQLKNLLGVLVNVKLPPQLTTPLMIINYFIEMLQLKGVTHFDCCEQMHLTYLE